MAHPLLCGVVRLARAAALWMLPSAAHAVDAVAVPNELQGWQDWALHGLETRRCPLSVASQGMPASNVSCAWPQVLTLNVDAHGGRFAQAWDVYADSWIALPGDEQHWPRDVKLNNAAAAVVLREGVPQLRLAAGHYAITGKFQWATRPEQLLLPSQIGLLALVVDGQPVVQPQRPGEALSFGRRRSAAQATAMEVQVYRLVSDQIPIILTTRLRLQVAGEAREELLARALPEGFVPVSLSGALPARLDADGRLRVQVRAGSFEITLVARGATSATALHRPALPAAAGRWPREEVWSFQGDDRLRVASAEGADGIDPAQANVPEDWRALPAYRMGVDSTLAIAERSRGLANADENRLTLARQLWLDFDHHGYTAVDTVSGQMRQGWRLDMYAPYRLESARSGEDNLLITQGAGAERTGLELRAPTLNVRTLERMDGVRGSVPATGWTTRFEHVSGQLNLPVGHRLLGILGPDIASGTWWSGWGLWSLFGVILVVVFTLRVVGWPAATVAFGALLLMYQENPSFIWAWANTLAAIGLAAVVPLGRLQRFVRCYRLVSVGLLGMLLLPMLFGQIRLAIYPQLEALGYRSANSMSEPRSNEREYGKLASKDDRVAMAGRAGAMNSAPMPASAAPPPVEIAAEEAVAAAGGAAEDKIEAAVVTSARKSNVSSYGLNTQQALQRYAPGTQIQTGPGIPGWRYQSYPYAWSGPVDPDARVRFIFIGPWLLALWRLAGVLLLGVWFFALLQRAFDLNIGGPLARGLFARFAAWLDAGTTRTALSAIGMLVMLGVGELTAPIAQAASTPDSALLGELRNRLAAPPTCAPNCAEITRAAVRVAADRLDVELNVSALAFVSVAIPSAENHWQIDSLSVDGVGSLAARRAGDGILWVPLRAGVRLVRISGRITATDSVQLAFPMRPRVVDVNATGWDVAGVNESRLISGTLELARRQVTTPAVGSAATRPDAAAAGVQFPAFVRVYRNFNLDLDWTVSSVVQRIAPARAAITVEIPLVAGESVLTDGIKLRDGKFALIGLPAGAAQTSWSSGLVRGDKITLSLPADVARSEVWNFSVNPQWRVSFSGVPAVLPDQADAPVWVFTYYPRPGETLQLDISRPRAVDGKTLAIDSVRHQRSVGARTSDEVLEFDYRSTQGGRHTISLPIGARVSSVQLDGEAAQLRPEKGELSIGLLPGAHSVTVRWQSPRGAVLAVTTDSIDLHSPASNIHTLLQLPNDRWALFVLGRGAGVGPAILYWGELAALLITAWVLGRRSWSPLHTYEWLLLGLGLSTLSWSVFVLVALWLFALRWRAQWRGSSRRWVFNLVQVSLALVSALAVGSLLFSGIQYGFLSSPNMGVIGDGSGGNAFAWFRDQTTSSLPAPLVFSVPIWVYKSLIFAWALWIALALTRWLKMAWNAWSSGGFWRSGTAVVPPRSQQAS